MGGLIIMFRFFKCHRFIDRLTCMSLSSFVGITIEYNQQQNTKFSLASRSVTSDRELRA